MTIRNKLGKNQWTNTPLQDRIMKAVTIGCDPGVIYEYTDYSCKQIILEDEPCWLFNTYVEKTGYTRFEFEGKRRQSHIYSWIAFYGTEVPEGLILDHLCLDKTCVNPRHLQPVTPTENDRRARFHYQQRKETCKNGHEFKDPNIIYRKVSATRVDRRCRICVNQQKAESYHKNKLAK
jgi:hypothetical protein